MESKNPIARFIGMLIGVAFVVWLIPAVTILVWDILAQALLFNIVDAGYLPASITWGQAFAICVFFFAANGYSASK
jgi:hypothetical protein